jgi:hypothetical protein
MPTCLLCSREFSQLEIDQGIRVDHAQSGRILMTRFTNGNLHQFSIEKKKLKPPVPRGAFVVSPKNPEAPPEEVATIPEAQSVEDLAQTLTDHFENPTGQDVGPHYTEPAKQAPAEQRHGRNAVEEIGNRLEGIVVHNVQTADVGHGFIRLLKYGRGERAGLFFRSDSIIKGDLIGLGCKVRCLVCPSLPPGKPDLQAREIEVLEIDAPEFKSGKSCRTKIYEREED